MRHKLIHHVEPGHFLEQFDEPGSRFALVANEKQAGIKFHFVPPRWPAFGGDIGAIVVGVRPAQNLSAFILHRSGQTHMRQKLKLRWSDDDEIFRCGRKFQFFQFQRELIFLFRFLFCSMQVKFCPVLKTIFQPALP